MPQHRDGRFTRIALILFFILLIGYGFYEGQAILFGPSITISSSVTEVSQPYIKIRGQAQRISSLSLNGQSVPVSEAGIFEEPYVLQPGENRIVFEAVDKYGRSRQKELDIVYVGVPPGAMDATSTASTTSHSFAEPDTTQSAATSVSQ